MNKNQKLNLKNQKFKNAFSLRNGDKKQEVFLFTSGTNTSKILDFKMDKEGRCLVLFVFFVLKNRDFLELKTATRHVAQNTAAFTYVRGVVYDEARVKYEGIIKIEPGGQMTNAYLQSNILLVGKGATSVNIPSLEIGANEVKASHGATVARMDEELLFYLRSRGLSRYQAEKLAIKGFFEPIIAKITSLKYQNLVRRLLFNEEESYG